MSEVAVVRSLDALAAAADAAWVWLLLGGAEPRPDALELLLAAREVPDARGPAVLLAGLVVGPDGRPPAFGLPAGTEHDTPAVLALAPHRVLPIRRAGLGCTLVAGAAVRRHGAPRARYGSHAGQEWSARVLRDGPGLLVPAAVAVAPATGGRSWGPSALAAAVRTARTPTWTRGESARALWAAVAPDRRGSGC